MVSRCAHGCVGQRRAHPDPDRPGLRPDRVRGLDAGADDYVVKPFAFDEVGTSGRVSAVSNRRPIRKRLRFADLTLNPITHEVHRGNRRRQLTTREFEVLLLFVQHPRQVITRDLLYDRIWGYDFGGESNIIEVYIRYVRSKLEEGGAPRLIQTVHGVGYALRGRVSMSIRTRLTLWYTGLLPISLVVGVLIYSVVAAS